MKIVDRASFLAMPAGTVFSKYSQGGNFGDLCIKGETIGEDFVCQYIASAVSANSSDELFDALDKAEDHGAELDVDLDFAGRDGLFNAEQLFAVWSDRDVAALIDRLELAYSDSTRELSR